MKNFMLFFISACKSIKQYFFKPIKDPKIYVNKIGDVSYYIYSENCDPDLEIYGIYRRKLHNYNGPAKLKSNGDLEWYEFGQYHRLYGPARIFKNKDKYQDVWCYKDELHFTKNSYFDALNEEEKIEVLFSPEFINNI